MRIRASDLAVIALAVAGLGTMAAIVAAGDTSYPVAPPVAAPPSRPFSHVVSGAGLVEASSENVAVGTPLAGVVEAVLVRVGERVAAGDPLFALDQRQVDAEIAARKAAVELARTRIDELLALEREAQDQFAKVVDLPDARAVSREEVLRRDSAVQAAVARVRAARAALELAAAELTASRVEKERLTVRAPLAGEVLQINLRVGEFAAPGAPMPLLVLGDTRTLHVRVDIDENDAWRVAADARAVAYVRASSGLSTPAQFVRFEPLVVPKRSLTGSSAERVDTRVLQVLFAFPREALPVYVGQQMDVMIEARPVGGRDG
ncbi:MAG: efflux RND transporter periplasmic adaptor subunit [Pseudomonadota bacterium]|jgi:HlyD family secretion protein